MGETYTSSGLVIVSQQSVNDLDVFLRFRGEGEKSRVLFSLAGEQGIRFAECLSQKLGTVPYPLSQQIYFGVGWIVGMLSCEEAKLSSVAPSEPVPITSPVLERRAVSIKDVLSFSDVPPTRRSVGAIERMLRSENHVLFDTINSYVDGLKTDFPSKRDVHALVVEQYNIFDVVAEQLSKQNVSA